MEDLVYEHFDWSTVDGILGRQKVVQGVVGLARVGGASMVHKPPFHRPCTRIPELCRGGGMSVEKRRTRDVVSDPNCTGMRHSTRLSHVSMYMP